MYYIIYVDFCPRFFFWYFAPAMYDCNFFLPVLMQECKQLHVHASSFKKRGTYEGRCPCVLFPGVRFSSSESKKKAAKQYPFRRHLPEIHCFKEKKEVLNPNVTLSCEFGLGQGSKKDPKCYFVCVALLVRQSVINWHSRFFVNLFIRKIFSNIVSPQVQFLFGHVFLRVFFYRIPNMFQCWTMVQWTPVSLIPCRIFTTLTAFPLTWHHKSHSFAETSHNICIYII